MRPHVLSAVLLILASCSDPPPPSADGVGNAIPPAPTPRAPVDPIYDENGVPRESEERVAGLVLPMGLEETTTIAAGRRHLYTSVVPPEPLLRYFGPRLNTVDIRHVGERVTYYDAVPRDARGGVVHLDVTIQPSSGEPARVEIFERPPPPPDGMRVSEEEIRRHLDEISRNRE
jgi:hypothetical protein